MSEALRQNDEKIIQLVSLLKKQRSELNFLIDNQENRKERLESAIDKLTRKLSLLTKSLTERQQIRCNYDITIKEIEANYQSLVGQSGLLLQHIFEGHKELEEIIDRKTSPFTNKQIVPNNGKELHELLGGIEGLPFRVLEMQELRTQNSLEIEKTIRNLNSDGRSSMIKPIEKRQITNGNARLFRQLDKIEEVEIQSDNSDNPRKVKSPSHQSTIVRKTGTKMAFQSNPIIEENKKLTHQNNSKYNSVFQTSGRNSRPNSNEKERKLWQSTRENYSYNNTRKAITPKHQNPLGINKNSFKSEERRQSSATNRPKIKEKPFDKDNNAGDMALTTISKKPERKKQTNKCKPPEKENVKTAMTKINNEEEYINSFLIEIKKQDNRRRASAYNKRSLSDNDTNLWGTKVAKMIRERPYSATKSIMNHNHQPVKQLEGAIVVKDLKQNVSSGGGSRRDKSPSKKNNRIDYLRKIYKF